MNVLGIFGFSYNPAACLIRDGRVHSFVEEERLTRLKGSDGMFPAKAVAHCLNSAKLTLGAVDRIAFGWDASKYPWAILRNFGWNYVKYRGRARRAFHKDHNNSSIITAVGSVGKWHPRRLRALIATGIRAAGFHGDMPKIEFVAHHLAHAYSTFFCSSFERAGILSIDGSGEELCTQLAIGEGKNIRVIESYAIPHSLGWFYAGITEYLGFIPHRDEGKMMGLAALGEARSATNKWVEPLSRVLRIGSDAYEVDPIYTQFGGHYYGRFYSDELVKLITSVDRAAEPVVYAEKVQRNGKLVSKYLDDVYVDIAWAAQEVLERAAIMLAQKLVRQHGCENLCIAGGVGLNCKMNGEILRRSGCKNIFVQPASYDAGVALGAAQAVAQALGDEIHHPISNPYTGPSFTNDDIRASLDNCKVAYRHTDDPSAEAARLVADGKIVAWFQGSMEYGARALGNRSILASPVLPEMKNRVNNQVKYRESWRPFCPSLADEAKSAYLEAPNEAGYMTVAYHMPMAMREKLPSIVHVDGTIRPQAVTPHSNPLYYKLIQELGRLTGHPVVLNTSFNVRGEPIICSPREALQCLYSNGLDVLVMGNFVVEKR